MVLSGLVLGSRSFLYYLALVKFSLFDKSHAAFFLIFIVFIFVKHA